MELRVLRYFLAIAREGSITNAAAFFHVTQPTLSRQIKDLESELGKRLFNAVVHHRADGVVIKGVDSYDVAHADKAALSVPCKGLARPLIPGEKGLSGVRGYQDILGEGGVIAPGVLLGGSARRERSGGQD